MDDHQSDAALQRECPVCGAKPGEFCRAVFGIHIHQQFIHTTRRKS